MDFASLILAIAIVESGGNPNAIGDNGKSFGELQIRKCVVEDVNRIYKTKFKHKDAFDRTKSKTIAIAYLRYWGKVYSERNETELTQEICARIWNGGPSGPLKDSTVEYWNKVKKELDKNAK